MKKKSAQWGRPALDLMEEAVQLLRTAPLPVILTYYIGAIPFTLGLLHFWADMSRGAFAERRCLVASFGMVLLFVWLKCWQAVFASALRAQLAGKSESKWDSRRVLRLILVQAILQPSRLFLQPVAFIVAIPFGWVTAFYENVTALGGGSDPEARSTLRRAATMAGIWPAQNHMVLALLSVAAIVLWLNALLAVLTVPHLLKTFLGIETMFSRAGLSIMLNTTFLAATVSLAWLALDPLVKAVYVLRCFHGAARQDGADLLAELSFVRLNRKTLALIALILFILTPMPARTAEPAATVSPAQIDAAVKATLQHDKYAWRLPRQKEMEEDSAAAGWLRTFFKSIGETLVNWATSLRDVFRNILEWFDRHFKSDTKPNDDSSKSKMDWMFWLRGFAYVLLAMAAAALAWLGMRLWRQGGRRTAVVQAEIIPAKPDLNSENVIAAQLPEDEWLKLAREMLDKGELRLALRAFYLASLAHLAAREIVSIARFKSNRDYETEVNRRARGSTELRAAFSANVSSFERVWYGLYEVTADTLSQFQSNFERIRSC